MAATLSDIITQMASAVRSLAQISTTFQTAFPKVTTLTIGSFTCAAAASTTVSNPLVAANSLIVLMPTNAAAATLMGGTKALYISARTANTSFVVTTASGLAAAGTETFTYQILTV